MNDKPASRKAQAFSEALGHLETALLILDEAGAPAQIGAHVDLAVCRLKEMMGVEPPGWNPPPPLRQ